MRNIRRMGAVLMALALVLSMNLTAFAAVEDTGFADVDADDWYAEAVEYVRDHGIMNGTTATTFNPDGTTSRGQIAAILYRASGSPEVSGGTAFTDVADTAYYADAVRWASAHGVVTGYGDGTFRPNNPITRQQLAAILWRYAGSPAPEGGADYADEDTISAYASTAVDWARDTGIISGRDGNRFDPNGRAARAQAAVILHRYDTWEPPIPEIPDPEPAPEEGSVLVAYFSATGNTERVANAIAAATGGDLFELTPVEPYTDADLNWTDEDSRVVYEYENPDQRDTELVTYAPDNWADYDVVFVGYPIWWYDAAWPVEGFVTENDFTGKTVIPFCTSSSSGIGESGERLAGLAGTGDWLEGERFRSRASDDDVQAWADSLDL